MKPPVVEVLTDRELAVRYLFTLAAVGFTADDADRAAAVVDSLGALGVSVAEMEHAVEAIENRLARHGGDSVLIW